MKALTLNELFKNNSMNLKFYPKLILTALLFTPPLAHAAPEVLPTPREMKTSRGATPLPTTILSPEDFAPQAEALQLALAKVTGETFASGTGENGSSIQFVQAAQLDEEEYLIDTRQDIKLSASSPTGIARASVSFLQLLEKSPDSTWQVPKLTIKDSPDYNFRAFLVDMGRNPHSPETLRRIIDSMWLAKTRYLHLHLTDDQLFSFPSTAYPELLSKNAGWTLADWHEIEAYSQARGVTIIPELEAPGHSGILRGKYPEVFGETPTDLASLDSAYEGLTTILKEMMDVFQATPFIHIGCDEAYGVDEKLQRDLVNRLHAFLKENGRQTIVWEGPRLGKGKNKVNEEVIHMNWRCIEMPAPQMIKEGYRVINATWDPLYVVDHYPRTMFTAVPSKDCYEVDFTRFKHINHAIGTFSNPVTIKKSDQLLGFCLAWWEGREENVIPLCRQRLTAATARAWNDRGETSFDSFLQRDQKLGLLLDTIRPRTLGEPTGGWSDREAEPTPGNLAHGKMVTVSAGASQPFFGPQRLTNGVTERFDHFLGFPTKPEPLEITIDLGKLSTLTKVDVYEAAVGKSWEHYKVEYSKNNKSYKTIGETEKGSRGEGNMVSHPCDNVTARYIRISTEGCQDLTFPSFSRLCEVMVFGE
ncbi:family 20 glycosylhydrolase [Roseibacillus persicicus]|nr:family 20 glycosylhydrolase [Roseibacillus persicicus]